MSENNEDNLFGQDHVSAYRDTGGERGYHWHGTEILLLTTTGRKLRRGAHHPADPPHRRRPLGDRGVQGRLPDHPGWYRNLTADPACHRSR